MCVQSYSTVVKNGQSLDVVISFEQPAPGVDPPLKYLVISNPKNTCMGDIRTEGQREVIDDTATVSWRNVCKKL